MRLQIAMAGALAFIGASGDALAQRQVRVLDTDYNGWLICDRMPGADFAVREAIVVSVARGKAAYTHGVRIRDKPEPGQEKGTGKVEAGKVALQGSWQGPAASYTASYEGSFVRRRAKLIGTQTWTLDGKVVTRRCSGTVQRPFRAFMSRAKKEEP